MAFIAGYRCLHKTPINLQGRAREPTARRRGPGPSLLRSLFVSVDLRLLARNRRPRRRYVPTT
jgi:hypothetical protein